MNKISINKNEKLLKNLCEINSKAMRPLKGFNKDFSK